MEETKSKSAVEDKGKLEREMWIDREIDTELLPIIDHILLINAEDKDVPPEERTPVRIYIYSPGGDPVVANSIANIIKLSLTPVHVVNMGECASAATIIYLAGHKRYALANSHFLFHKGYTTMEGTYDEVERHFENYKRILNQYSEILCAAMGLDAEEVHGQLSREWYFYAEEAAKTNIVDELVQDIAVLI